MPVATKDIARYWPWIVVAVAILFTVTVRFRLREMALERDEGEYAYAGQLILHGVPPYKDAYNMKLPGTYVAYAVLMGLFGQSAAGLHFGVALVNAATIILVFIFTRRLAGRTAGAAAAVSYALLSLSPAILGLAGHATHFVVLFVLAGMLVLLDVCDHPQTPILRLPPALLAGLLFGLALLMKQHAALFGIFAGLYLLWYRYSDLSVPWAQIRKEVGLYTAGFVLPLALLCCVLGLAGVLRAFYFWTVVYAREYVSAVPLFKGVDVLGESLRSVVGSDLFFWLLAGIAAVFLIWQRQLKGQRVLLSGFLVCSLVSVCVGLYFRPHYFIMLLPALALLSGIAVSRAVRLVRNYRAVGRLLGVPLLALFASAVVVPIVGHGGVWFRSSPEAAAREIYGTSLFSDAKKVAGYIKEHSSKGARVAVLGSEPEIYFDSRRRSATGYIYTYPLMEAQPYALKMQEEMIGQIERATPEYVVYVDDTLSWLEQSGSPRRIYEWWKAYWATNLELVTTTEIVEHQPRKDADSTLAAQRAAATESAGDPGTKHILLLKRK